MPAWFDDFVATIDDGTPEALVCGNCDATSLPPRQCCPTCGARTLTTTDLPTTGEIVSYTEISVSTPKFHGDTPYTVVLASLGDTTITGQLRDEPVAGIAIGDRVRIGTESRAEGTPVITFSPVEG